MWKRARLPSFTLHINSTKTYFFFACKNYSIAIKICSLIEDSVYSVTTRFVDFWLKSLYFIHFYFSYYCVLFYAPTKKLGFITLNIIGVSERSSEKKESFAFVETFVTAQWWLIFEFQHHFFFTLLETWKICFFQVYWRYWRRQANHEKIKPKFKNPPLSNC